MSNFESDFDQACDDYLYGAMTATEITEFESILKNDPEKAAHWQEYQLLMQGVREYGRRRLFGIWYDEANKGDSEKRSSEKVTTTLFDKWKQEQKQADGQSHSKGGGTFTLFRFISAAAVLVVVFFAGWWLANNREQEVGHGEDFAVLQQLSLPVVPLEGGTTAAAEVWEVTVQNNPIGEYVAILNGKQLTLLLPLHKAPTGIRLRKSDSVNEPTVYLQIQDKWYSIRTDEPHEQLLHEIKDEAILSRLK